jgi:hypothetical protein
MSLKSRIGMCAALVAAFVACGAAASAATISYTTTGLASGDWEFPGETANPFTDANLAITVSGDTANAYTVAGSDYHFQPFDHATLASGLGTFDIVLDPGVSWLAIFGNNGSNGFAAFGRWDGSQFTADLTDGGPGLFGYAGNTNLGPIPVGSSWPNEIDLTNGAHVNISGVHGATFSAAVPEPATWAMLLLGFGGLGAALRSKRRPALVA